MDKGNVDEVNYVDFCEELVRNTITALTISLKHVHELAKLRSLETHLLMLMMSVLALENFAHKSASVSANFSEILTS
jgi:hypothetical protein